MYKYREIYYVLVVAIILTVLGIIGVLRELQPKDLYAIFLAIGGLTLMFITTLSITGWVFHMLRGESASR
jgi:hypothetical protein